MQKVTNNMSSTLKQTCLLVTLTYIHVHEVRYDDDDDDDDNNNNNTIAFAASSMFKEEMGRVIALREH